MFKEAVKNYQKPKINISSQIKPNQNLEQRLIGCFIRVPQLKRPLPLKRFEYLVNVTQNISEVNICQDYVNDIEKPMDVEYLFNIDESAAFSQLTVHIGERTLYGIIKEKQVAINEYNQGVNQGKTMIYAETENDFPNFMKVKLGNIMPGDALRIEFTYIQELQVCVNKFWRLVLPSNHYPRSKGKKVALLGLDDELREIYQAIQNQKYTLNIEVNIIQKSDITFIDSPSHKIKFPIKQNNIAQIILADGQNYDTNKDFILTFATNNIHEPIAQIEMIKNDALAFQKYCACVSFIPQFNPLNQDDAYRSYKEDNELKNDEYFFKEEGNFIFLLDRSGSMSGSRINKAKDALLLFLKSLPTNSYFNIVSFGTSYEFLQNKPIPYNKQNLEMATKDINRFQADLGGTNIIKPLEQVYSKLIMKQCSNNIFLLTDGEVNDPEKVIDLIKENVSGNMRVYSIGIGTDCSQYLIEKSSTYGNGKFEFILENSDMNQKVISLLQDSITPFLEKFTIDVQPEQLLTQIIPNPQSLYCVRKNEAVTFFLMFSDLFQDKLKISIKCNDPQNQTELGYNVVLDIMDAIEKDIFHKLCAHKTISSIIQAQKLNENYLTDVLMAYTTITEAEIIQISLQNQVICPLTAFICEVKQDIEGDQVQQALKDKILCVQQLQTKKRFLINQESAPRFAQNSILRNQISISNKRFQPQPHPMILPPTLGALPQSMCPPPQSMCPPPQSMCPPPQSMCPPPQSISRPQPMCPPQPPKPFIQQQCSFSSKQNKNFVQQSKEMSRAKKSVQARFQTKKKNLQDDQLNFFENDEENCFEIEEVQQQALEKCEQDFDQLKCLKNEKQNCFEIEEQQEIYQQNSPKSIPVNQLNFEQADKKVKKVSGYIEIIQMQQLDGSFLMEKKLIQMMGLDQNVLENQQIQIDNTIFMTMIVLQWLKYNFPNDFEALGLILKKAQRFLTSNQIKLSDYMENIQRIIQI